MNTRLIFINAIGVCLFVAGECRVRSDRCH